jgi:adenylylsulfate kinase-like enzyme
VLELDGDRLRQGLCAGLSFSDADRAENLRRAAEVARVATESGLVVVASFITPRRANRAAVVRIVGAERIRLVHVAASLDTCRARDVKGLYALEASGKMPPGGGISSTFETPEECQLELDTAHAPPEASAKRLLAFARAELR